jgi:hypothetical protein
MVEERSGVLLFALGIFAPISVNYSSIVTLIPSSQRTIITNKSNVKPAVMLSP